MSLLPSKLPTPATLVLHCSLLRIHIHFLICVVAKAPFMWSLGLSLQPPAMFNSVEYSQMRAGYGFDTRLIIYAFVKALRTHWCAWSFRDPFVKLSLPTWKEVWLSSFCCFFFLFSPPAPLGADELPLTEVNYSQGSWKCFWRANLMGLKMGEIAPTRSLLFVYKCPRERWDLSIGFFFYATLSHFKSQKRHLTPNCGYRRHGNKVQRYYWWKQLPRSFQVLPSLSRGMVMRKPFCLIGQPKKYIAPPPVSHSMRLKDTNRYPSFVILCVQHANSRERLFPWKSHSKGTGRRSHILT